MDGTESQAHVQAVLPERRPGAPLEGLHDLLGVLTCSQEPGDRARGHRSGLAGAGHEPVANRLRLLEGDALSQHPIWEAITGTIFDWSKTT